MSVIAKRPENINRPWVVRWQQSGKQHERGFSTKTEARKFQTDVDHSLRYGAGDTDLKAASRIRFGDAALDWIRRLPVNDRSKESYRGAYRTHVAPVMGNRTLAQVAADRDGVTDLLVAMKSMSASPRRQARMVILGTCDEAVKAGKLTGHKLAGIPVDPGTDTRKYEDFTPATTEQIDILATVGISVYLGVYCGLRPQEALAVHREHFRTDGAGHVLRVSQQATRDGALFTPCKKRRSTTQFRDVPVNDFVWDLVKDLPPGPVMPGKRAYRRYETTRQAFNRARELTGLPRTYTMHSLRHQYGSVLLRAGVPPTDVAGWMGHRSLDTLYRAYRSELAGARTDAVKVLDALRAA